MKMKKVNRKYFSSKENKFYFYHQNPLDIVSLLFTLFK